MSRITDGFAAMYACQTRTMEIAILATVAGYGTNKQALLSGVDQSDAYIPGSTALPNQSFMLQILGTDLSAKPEHGTQVTCNGSATGLTLQVIDSRLVNGIWELDIGDIQNE